MTNEEPLEDELEEESEEEEQEIYESEEFMDWLESRQLKDWYITGDEHAKIMAEVLYRVTYSIDDAE